MATQALITAGTLASTAFPADEANMLVQSATLTPTKEKREYKGANAKGSVVAVQWRNPTATLAIDGYLTALAGFAVQEIGTSISTHVNWTNIGTAAGITVADADAYFEDPVISATNDEQMKLSFKMMLYPSIA